MGLRGPAGLEERFRRLSRKGDGKETKKQEEVFDVGCAEIFFDIIIKGFNNKTSGAHSHAISASPLCLGAADC